MAVHPATLVLLAYSILDSNGNMTLDTVNIVSQETKQLLIQLAGAKELTTTPQ